MTLFANFFQCMYYRITFKIQTFLRHHQHHFLNMSETAIYKYCQNTLKKYKGTRLGQLHKIANLLEMIITSRQNCKKCLKNNQKCYQIMISNLIFLNICLCNIRYYFYIHYPFNPTKSIQPLYGLVNSGHMCFLSPTTPCCPTTICCKRAEENGKRVPKGRPCILWDNPGFCPPFRAAILIELSRLDLPRRRHFHPEFHAYGI